MVHRLILMSKEGLIAKLAKSCKRRFLTLYARLRAVGDFGAPSTDEHAKADKQVLGVAPFHPVAGRGHSSKEMHGLEIFTGYPVAESARSRAEHGHS